MKRVLVFNTDLPLAAGVESLLVGEGDFLVKSVIMDEGKDLSSELESFRPEVVIFDGNLHLSGLYNLVLILKSFPRVRIIVLVTEGNIIQILDKQEVVVTHAKDLAEAVRYTSVTSS